MAQPGKARHGAARLGMARLGVARYGEARQGKAWIFKISNWVRRGIDLQASRKGDYHGTKIV